MLRILNILHDTTVDGPGFRTSIYAAGCRHACVGCHNPESWPMYSGRDMSVGEVLVQVLSDPFANVTFTGGDPFFQADEFARLAREIKKLSTKTIWCYTGFTFERLYQSAYCHHPVPAGSRLHYCGLSGVRALMQCIDVMVDGPFVQSLRDTELMFRGSSNQRLIDVRLSLAAGRTIVWERS